MNEQPHTHYCPHCRRFLACDLAARGGCLFASTSPITCRACAERVVAALDRRKGEVIAGGKR